MTDPTDDEMDRAERIRKLRSGGAQSRSQEVREQRREAAGLDSSGAPAGVEEDGSEQDERGDGKEGDGGEDGEGEDGGEAVEDAIGEADRADVVEMAADLPEDGSLFVLPVDPAVRRAFNRMAEQLHLEYGFEFDEELDPDTHLRPLALYLGIMTLEDADAGAVRDLLRSIDGLEAPGEGDAGPDG